MAFRNLHDFLPDRLGYGSISLIQQKVVNGASDLLSVFCCAPSNVRRSAHELYPILGIIGGNCPPSRQTANCINLHEASDNSRPQFSNLATEASPTQENNVQSSQGM
ncbi:hypothetical protein T4A_5505 [Trichinella pseudospiralis]|uniref:Uncharacterized protein n=1 Tax=Trichinella pseudospiralis TaxID=6337 RepID=A0A0V1EV90_TRIPS|nr:hypothetical protein T4A_5505 [Trichinella pseudospiralis]